MPSDSQNYTAMGAFTTPGTATAAAEVLLTSGFEQPQVNLLMGKAAKDRGAHLHAQEPVVDDDALGSVTAGIIGALTVGLSSLALVSLPGLGLLATGPLAVLLAGGAGAAAGGLLGGLWSMGLSEHQAEQYQKIIDDGGMVVVVQCEDMRSTEKALDLLRQAGAHQIETEVTEVAMPKSA